ncbi:aspartyl-phosphate phosphatase Spo0E family protein [Paenibacillus albiflavus]|uniref:Aspartyl-phosphate phosphatase Spo0E family protein n=1 Tax=Paenibacillus albiflavus TaxID=2545760 RepID=A0A4R4E8G7_9BACL|nr:aspartyl-phosphate phosphatase Spo0E family protein [Paenibacillus albiflavus]
MNKHTKVILLGTSSTAPLEAIVSSQIEYLRGRMVFLGTRYGLRHPAVQQCSEQLDELLLEFYNSKQKLVNRA